MTLKLFLMRGIATPLSTKDAKSLPLEINRFLTKVQNTLLYDMKIEQKSDISDLQIMHHTRIFMKAHEQDVRGLGLYLGCFRGVHDYFLLQKLNKAYLKDFAYVVFTVGCPFEGYYFRLLELTNDYKLASMLPCKEDVSAFVLRNFRAYVDKKDWLRLIYQQLKKQRKQVNNAVYSYKNYSSTYLLYKLCRKHLLWSF